MPLRNNPLVIVTALIIVAATLGFAIQVVTNQPPMGTLSLSLLFFPGFVLTQALAPGHLSWPEVTVSTIGSSLAILVLTGIVAALSAHGLDASSVAASELLATELSGTIWVWRLRQRHHGLPTKWIRVHLGSVLLIAAGMALGGAGIAVATRAAEEQDYPGFVQLWSTPAVAGSNQMLGVRNATGLTVTCDASIDRPGKPRLDVAIGSIADGQSWQGALPPKDGADPRPWEVKLHCTASDGSGLDRRLSIDPPA